MPATKLWRCLVALQYVRKAILKVWTMCGPGESSNWQENSECSPGVDMERLDSISADPGQSTARSASHSVGLRKVLELETKLGHPFCGSDQG